MIPGGNFEPETDGYEPLPQTPFVNGVPVTNPELAYQGEKSEAVFSGYSGYYDELIIFALDGKLYDEDGFLVNYLRLEDGANNPANSVLGTNEMLILPMGNSCERFAVIYPGSSTNQYHHTTIDMDVYFGIYDIKAENTFNPLSKGAMVGQGPNGTGPTLQSMKEDFFVNHDRPGLGLYSNNNSGYHVAASKLIDGCFRYVWICDSRYIIRYKLDAFGLHYDSYYLLLNQIAANLGGGWRTEMELMQPNDSTFRMAIPFGTGGGSDEPERSIHVLDFDSTMTMIPGSHKKLGFENVPNENPADPHGIEFDKTGRYVYFTHKTNSLWPNSMDIWDVETDQVVTPTLPSGMFEFENSFIERYGEELYLIRDEFIGQISNASNPSSFTLDHSLVNIGPDHGNDMNQGNNAFRFILPDQVDDGKYGNFDEFSCKCCKRFKPVADSLHKVFETAATEIWTPQDNPFNDDNSGVVSIRDELRILAGADIDIRDMAFYFKPGARVIIERGDENTRGAMLSLRNSVFTLDYSCADSIFRECPDTSKTDTCEMRYWQGIEVWGYPNQHQPTALWDGLSRPSYPSTPQGKFSMFDSSRVELAEIGVLAGAREHEPYGGGIVTATESSFIDNQTGMKFHPYAPVNGSNHEIPNKSTVRGCAFDWTWGSTIIDSVPQLNAHVELNGISDIGLRGNTYKNSLPLLPMKSRGYGVRLLNSGANITWLCTNPAGFHLLPCDVGKMSEFHHLHVGVSGLNDANNLRKLKVYASDFDNNHYGVSLSNFINPELLDNTFSIPRHNASRGIVLMACDGYDLENNHFAHQTGFGFPTSAGLMIVDSGEDDNLVYRNTFEDLRFAAVSQGVNGNLQLDDSGLRYSCNTFNYPIRQSDIFVMSGNISDEQGTCALGEPDNPAGNLFSHSVETWSGHMDFRVSLSGVFPPALEIQYRHHFSESPDNDPDPWVPRTYTGGNRVNLNNCVTIYWDAFAACPVMNSSGFPNFFSQGLSNSYTEEESASFQSAEEIWEEAEMHQNRIDSLGAFLDNGQTFEILSMIREGEDSEIIESLLDQTGSSPGATVIKALIASEQFDIQDLGYSLLAEDNETFEENGPSLSSVYISENESEWKVARREARRFWRNVTDFYMTDTTGILTPDYMASLLSTFKPRGIDRFTSSFADVTQLINPEWIRSEADVAHLELSGFNFPEPVNGSLPGSIDDLFEQGFFRYAGNVAALNSLYAATGDSYFPPMPEADTDFDSDSEKSLHGNDEAQKYIKAFPNPFNREVTFELSDFDADFISLELRIFDVTGRSVWSGVFGAEAKTLVVDGREFPKGMLIYQVIIDGADVENGKVMRVE